MVSLSAQLPSIKRHRSLLEEVTSQDKNLRSRMAKYLDWLDNNDLNWLQPDLGAWRDDLLELGMSPASIRVYLSNIRSAYDQVIGSSEFRDLLYNQARSIGVESPADQKAFVDELTTRIEQAIDPKATKVRVATHQDQPESQHLRLTKGQAEALIVAPGVATLTGLRDTAVILTLLCTGIREAELVTLDVPDLRQEFGGELALHVRQGKGSKVRLVPYGDLDWCLAIVDRWLEVTGIDAGPVFRGLYKSGRRMRPGRLSVRGVENILSSYPIAVGGRTVTVKPHDCRRTYARRLYEAGVDLVAIQQNLGHAGIKTTQGYIGELDASYRRAAGVYSFDLARLDEAPKRMI